MQTTANSGKHDDTSSLRDGIQGLIPPDVLRGLHWNDVPSSYWESILNPDIQKTWRGFNNKLTAMFLCPESYIEDMKAGPEESVADSIPLDGCTDACAI